MWDCGVGWFVGLASNSEDLEVQSGGKCKGITSERLWKLCWGNESFKLEMWEELLMNKNQRE